MNPATNTTVYLLEQDTHTFETVRTLCHEKSITLEQFDYSHQLLEAVERHHPDCIIMATVSEEDAAPLNILNHFHHQNMATPVIILGHHNDIHMAIAVIKAGAIDCIEKPVIYGRLANHLDRVKQQCSSASSSV